MKSSDLCCVVVAFNPDVAKLCNVIESILKWSRRIILVDNTPSGSYCVDDLIKYDIDIIQVGENIGIGAAQNKGILRAVNLGFSWIVLSDQDTLFPANYGCLMMGWLQADNSACAIVPTFIDSHRSSQSIIKATIPAWHGWKKIAPPQGIFNLYEGAASGMVLKVASLKQVGLMNEDLFIDWVDFEWCWRARSHGFKILGTSEVRINHTLGNGAISIGKKVVNIRPPIRHYYITRNCLYLAIYAPKLSINCRLRLFLKALVYFISYPTLMTPRTQNFNAVIKGFRDGLIRRLGKYKP